MKTKHVLCLISTLALASGVLAQTQSLPELAKAEKARRAKIRSNGGAAKLYTEGDKSGMAVAAMGADGQVTGDTQTAAAAPASGKKEKSAQELAAEKQREWAEKVQKAQDEIKAVEDAIARNERSLASMYNITPARADMVNAIESDKKRVAALKQSLIALEDERRRAGLPRAR